MNIVSGFVLYLVIWWVVFFIVLPWGNEASNNPMVGHDPGAPLRPRLKIKILIASFVAFIIWGIAYYVLSNRLVSLT